MSLYAPREDSFLLQKFVKKYAFGKVLDIGTGTGIQAVAAASNKKVKSVIAIDIDSKIVEYCKREVKNKKIKFLKSDLFSAVNEKFDTIIFNPPYLPADEFEPDIALIGGKKGHETAERFLDNANRHLNTKGIVLLLFSSLTNKSKIDEIIERNCLVSEQLAEEGVGLLEKLYVYLIKKSDLLLKLEKLGISDIKLFAKGHRGAVYVGKLKGKKVAVKVQLSGLGFETISNEVNCLKRLNKYSIGPKILYSKPFIYSFVEGEFIEEFVKKSGVREIKRVLSEVMKQCRILDKLGYNKEEMHHPYKHVIVGKKVVLIDFERCRKTKDPKNVTQFCQYLIGSKMAYLLKGKKIGFDREKMIKLAKDYKRDFSEKSFKRILSEIQ